MEPYLYISSQYCTIMLKMQIGIIPLFLFIFFFSQIQAQSWQVQLPGTAEDISELEDGSLLVHAGDLAYHYSQNGDLIETITDYPFPLNYFTTIEVINMDTFLVSVDSLDQTHFQVPLSTPSISIFANNLLTSNSGLIVYFDGQNDERRVRVFNQNGMIVYEETKPTCCFNFLNGYTKRDGSVVLTSFSGDPSFNTTTYRLFDPEGQLVCTSYETDSKLQASQSKLIHQIAMNGAGNCGAIEQYLPPLYAGSIFSAYEGWVYPCINNFDSLLINNWIPNNIEMIGLAADAFAVLGNNEELHVLTRIDCETPILPGLCILPVNYVDTIISCTDDPFEYEGILFNNYHTHQFNYTSENGCDSIVILTAGQTFNETVNIYPQICEGETFEFDGVIMDSTGIYEFNYQTQQDNCDSTIFVNLQVHESEEFWTLAACNQVTWNDVTYTASGMYTQEETTQTGCDILINLDVTVYEAEDTTLTASACDVYVWNNQTFDESGIYPNTLSTQYGCDSLIELNLTIYQPTTSSISLASCESINWYDQTISEPGVYSHISQNQNGCDSLIELTFSFDTLDNSIYADGNTLIANASNVNYQWIQCNGTPILNATTKSFDPSESGYYAVIISSELCESISECLPIFLTNTKQIGESSFNLYPNPTADFITIDFEKSVANLSIHCYNINGRLMDEYELHQTKNVNFDFSHYAKGLYFLKLTSNEFSQTVKVIKE